MNFKMRNKIEYLHDGKINEICDDGKALIVSAIRRFGGSDHPVPTVDGVSSFSVDYSRECLERAIESGHLSSKGVHLAERVISTLDSEV